MPMRNGPGRDPFEPINAHPLLRGQRPIPVVISLAITLLAVAGVASTLLLVGEPALRIQYWYRGTLTQPAYQRCTYLGLTGMRDVRASAPGVVALECPIIAFFRLPTHKE